VISAIKNAIARFQYPRLDRRVENVLHIVLRCKVIPVSVSTTGSKGRKPGLSINAIHDVYGFSIHDWIEGSKTGLPVLVPDDSGQFQYPRLDRRVENDPVPDPAPDPERFSIHDWIEGSKTISTTRRCASRHGFSIHDWIEGSKTPTRPFVFAAPRCFSIHDWIEGSKTAAAAWKNVSKACFSIHDWIEGSKTMGNQIMPGQVKGFSIHDWIEGSKT